MCVPYGDPIETNEGITTRVSVLSTDHCVILLITWCLPARDVC